MLILEAFSFVAPGGGVCIWRVQLKPNNTDSLNILKPKMFGILHISYSKIWVTIFIENWVSISNFQFKIVLYNLGQLDSTFFSFWKQFPGVFFCPILVIIWQQGTYFEVLQNWTLEICSRWKFYPQKGKFMLQILDKKWLSREVWDPKKWHTKPLYTKMASTPSPPEACYNAWLNIHI